MVRYQPWTNRLSMDRRHGNLDPRDPICETSAAGRLTLYAGSDSFLDVFKFVPCKRRPLARRSQFLETTVLPQPNKPCRNLLVTSTREKRQDVRVTAPGDP